MGLSWDDVGDAFETLIAPAYSVYRNQRDARRAEDAALEEQRNAMRQADARAAAQARQSEMEFRRVNQKQPDFASILLTEESASLLGAASTNLTGAGGIGRDRLNLGPKKLVGF